MLGYRLRVVQDSQSAGLNRHGVADDSVVGFERLEEAERFLEELQERLALFGLSLRSDKTRLIEFGRFASDNRKH